MSSWLLEGMAGGPAQRDYAGVDVRSASLSALGCVPQFPPPQSAGDPDSSRALCCIPSDGEMREQPWKAKKHPTNGGGVGKPN